jgi:PAS domain S-box-containing protein
MTANSKILVVGDDPHARGAVASILIKEGCEVFDAGTGQACLAMARATHPDLVLIEIVGPDIDGLESCRLLKAEPALASIFVILMSASPADSAPPSLGLESGADGRIALPVSNRELADRVEGFLRIQRAETALRKSEEKYSKVFKAVEQSPVSIIITDSMGRIEYINPKFTQLTGYTLDEVKGNNPRVLKGDKTSDGEYRRLWCAITQGREWRGEFHNRKKNGDFYWESALISPIFDAGGRITHFLAVKEDITERKALEEQFLQAQKLESIGQLAGGVAHDFNNIMAATMMHLSFLQQNPNLDAETKKSLRDLMVDAKRAASLTRQLLLFSRKSILEVVVLDLNEVVAGLLKMLARLIGEHISVRFERGENLPAVEADAVMIEQVVMNLSINARDAMPKGGALTIGLETVAIDAEHARGNLAARPGRFVRLSVADTGCGMDNATLKRIFEPFFTTKESGQGTGLGLATVHGIVALHKGWVEVESAPGKGANFNVFLPATTKRMAETGQTEAMAPMGGRETILLVEDDTTLRRVVAQNLRLLGYGVLEADAGPTASKLWREHSRKIDVLITDVVLPEGLSGLELAEKLTKEKPGLKVIVCSGYNVEIAARGNLPALDIVYLQKPFQIEVLSKVIRDCLDRAKKKGMG